MLISLFRPTLMYTISSVGEAEPNMTIKSKVIAQRIKISRLLIIFITNVIKSGSLNMHVKILHYFMWFYDLLNAARVVIYACNPARIVL